MSTLGPWVGEELPPSKRKKAPGDELRVAFKEVWELNLNHFRDKQSSTNSDESYNGTLLFDKFGVADTLSAHIRENHPDWQTARWTPAQIARVVHWAAEDVGKDRTSIAKRKAEYQAIQEAAGAQTNGQHSAEFSEPEPEPVSDPVSE